ncbi:MAG: hypothetical protein QOF83_2296 [Solirubrobacteraceae bacterium]|jgi:UPF0716 family protein affecting phage T7 exclusion|nr:hypothetical protein [Solirubrobacteraceae bacterium]
MSPRPDHDGRRSVATRETSATSQAATFAHVGGAAVLALSYLALIPGFLPAFVLAAVLGLVLLVPILAIAVASGLLLLPILALRRLARHRRHSGDTGDSAAKQPESRSASGVHVERSPAPRGEDAALPTAMNKQIQEIRSLPEIVPPQRLSTKPNSDQDHTER